MKAKSIVFTIFLCLLCFILGYAGNNFFQQKKEADPRPIVKTDSVESVKEIQADGTKSKDINQKKDNPDYSKLLKGKYILKDADYAGFEFLDANTVTWTNEILPMYPDTMRLKWIDERTFVTTFTESAGKECPPRNWVRQIESNDGNKLVIKNFWTGWNDSKDTSEIFYKE